MIIRGTEDLRVQKTMAAIEQAFSELLLENDEFERISVTALCARAKINKKTFYHYYRTLDELLQEMLEICLVAIVAFPMAYLTSREMAGTLGTLFGKVAENVIVTPQHFVMVGAAGAGLLIIAVLVSCIPVMRMKPKAILSQME